MRRLTLLLILVSTLTVGYFWLKAANLKTSLEIVELEQRVQRLRQNNRDLETVLDKLAEQRAKTVYGKASWLVYQLHDSCATRDWKKGTRLVVRSATNSIICVVRDFGPDASVFPERIVDLNKAQFAELAPTSVGVINISVTPL